MIIYMYVWDSSSEWSECNGYEWVYTTLWCLMMEGIGACGLDNNLLLK